MDLLILFLYTAAKPKRMEIMLPKIISYIILGDFRSGSGSKWHQWFKTYSNFAKLDLTACFMSCIKLAISYHPNNQNCRKILVPIIKRKKKETIKVLIDTLYHFDKNCMNQQLAIFFFDKYIVF